MFVFYDREVLHASKVTKGAMESALSRMKNDENDLAYHMCDEDGVNGERMKL